jgi:hypothetical protein
VHEVQAGRCIDSPAQSDMKNARIPLKKKG